MLTAVLVFFCDKKLFAQADYCLLGTFVCFFVFVGNIARVDAVRAFFAGVMQGRELWVSAALSQCISNVPGAVMLSGFTENAKALLLGVNLGGLGTPIASLASLISYQFYSKAAHSRPGKIPGHFLCRELRDAGGPAGSRLATAAFFLGRFPHTPDTGHPADAPTPWSRQGAVRGSAMMSCTIRYSSGSCAFSASSEKFPSSTPLHRENIPICRYWCSLVSIRARLPE